MENWTQTVQVKRSHSITELLNLLTVGVSDLVFSLLHHLSVYVTLKLFPLMFLIHIQNKSTFTLMLITASLYPSQGIKQEITADCDVGMRSFIKSQICPK